ncbi:hypothetical protein C8F01DRAFT_1306261 [Mycena amicta]|nr:hypothetical protein C8F01DRAFT_1306261 [Mycena amicta]
MANSCGGTLEVVESPQSKRCSGRSTQTMSRYDGGKQASHTLLSSSTHHDIGRGPLATEKWCPTATTQIPPRSIVSPSSDVNASSTGRRTVANHRTEIVPGFEDDRIIVEDSPTAQARRPAYRRTAAQALYAPAAPAAPDSFGGHYSQIATKPTIKYSGTGTAVYSIRTGISSMLRTCSNGYSGAEMSGIPNDAYHSKPQNDAAFTSTLSTIRIGGHSSRSPSNGVTILKFFDSSSAALRQTPVPSIRPMTPSVSRATPTHLQGRLQRQLGPSRNAEDETVMVVRSVHFTLIHFLPRANG